jgi:hypothetical protein
MRIKRGEEIKSIGGRRERENEIVQSMQYGSCRRRLIRRRERGERQRVRRRMRGRGRERVRKRERERERKERERKRSKR